MIIRQAVSSRIGANIEHHHRKYVIKRAIWWKNAVNLPGKEEWKSALKPWTYWYYEIEPIKEVRETEEVAGQAATPQSGSSV